MAFSHTGGKFIGNFDNFGFRGLLGYPSIGSEKIPDLLFALYQGMFSAITYVLFLLKIIIFLSYLFTARLDRLLIWGSL